MWTLSTNQSGINVQQPTTTSNQTLTNPTAQMLVIFQNCEQRLFFLTLPKETPRTPQELLEIVNVPFSADTNIQWIHNPGISNPDGQINFIVTVNSVADVVQQQQQPRSSLGNVTLQTTGFLTAVLRTQPLQHSPELNKLAQQGDRVITKITKNQRKPYVRPQQKAANAIATLEELEEILTEVVVTS
jgi:hypothetical protein